MEDISAKMIHYPSIDATTPGYLAQPSGDGPYSALVVIQEWWGLVPHIKDVVERLARQGFVALAPDLYHGLTADEPDEARKLAMELDRDRAVKEIDAAAHYLQGLSQVQPKAVGVVGWCMGGSLAVATAAASTAVGATVAFYGIPRDLEIVKNIHIPLLGLYGELDQGVSPAAVQSFAEALQQAGITHEVHIYPGAPHAFFNDARPHIYQPEAAADAWERTLTWFRKYLV